MDAVLVMDCLKKYRTGAISRVEAGFALILLGCSGQEAAALMDREDKEKKEAENAEKSC
jgi:hypothetical protein